MAIPPILFAAVMTTFSFRFLDGEFGWYQQNKDYAAVREPYARVLIVGDSTAKSAYIPDILGESSYNLGLGGVGPMEEYYYLRDYLKNNDPPAYVFLTFSIRYLNNVSDFWHRSVYFHRLTPGNLCDCLVTLGSKGNIRETLKTTTSQAIVNVFEYTTYSPLKYRDAFLRGIESDERSIDNWINYDKSAVDRGWWLVRSEKSCSRPDSYLANNQVFTIDAGFEQYLNLIFELCEDNDIEIIFEAQPLNDATYAVLTDGFKETYRAYMSKLQERYPSAIINKDLHAYPDDYFCDSRHMNRRGAECFSRGLIDRYPQVFEESP